MIILAFDQATIKSGYSIYQDEKLIKHGVINLHDEKIIEERMYELKEIIKIFINTYKPNLIVLEDIQLQRNPQTYKTLAKLKGIIEEYLYENNIKYTVIKPSEWRKICGIKGRKRKEQKKNSIKKVKKLFSIDTTDDESDAILIGYAIVKLLKKKRSEK